MFRIAIFASLALWLTQPMGGQVRVVNHGVVPDRELQVQDDILVYGVQEAFNGIGDLNGDGDAHGDQVVFVYDASTETTTNLRLASFDIGKFGTYLNERRLLVLVSEHSQGMMDLNGNGRLDQALFLYDVDSGATVNLQASSNIAPFGMFIEGDRVFYHAVEYSQGVDSNGDGDLLDSFWGIYDIETMTTNRVPLASRPLGSASSGRLLFVVGESDHGLADLNGDGDVKDWVHHVHDAEADRTTNLAIAGPIHGSIDGEWIAVDVFESDQGGSDLNGDGDASDAVPHVFHMDWQSSRSFGLASGGLVLEDRRMALLVPELGQGNTDLNGDGDVDDSIVHVHDLEAERTSNLRLHVVAFNTEGFGGVSSASMLWDESGRWLAFGVSEAGQGAMDLNGDGDSSDVVLHVYDARDEGLVNLGFAIDLKRVDFKGSIVAFSVAETDQGNQDLNGDDDAQDTGLLMYDVVSGDVVNLGFAIEDFVLGKDWLVFQVNEYSHGQTDLDGDGELGRVAHYYETSNGSIGVLPVPLHFINYQFGSLLRPRLDGDLLAFVVSERMLEIDLNGDGDEIDSVLHSVVLPHNTAPVVTVEFPLDGDSFVAGDVLEFSGSASDAEDGDLSGGLTWTSTIDGSIGSGSSWSTSSLSVGTHVITASATDGGGLTTASSVTVDVVMPVAPTVSLAVNGEHPPSSVVVTTGPLHLTLEMTTGTETDGLDWYYAVVVNETIYWATPSGFTTTPGTLLHHPPVTLDGATLLNKELIPGSLVTFFFILADGAEIVSYDVIIVIATS